MAKSFEPKKQENVLNDRVFVVHGRNEELRKSMFDFLRSIGLKPIEWSQAIQLTGESSPYIGSVLDVAFQHAQSVVVLLTGDDEAKLRQEYLTDKHPSYEKNLTPQARPNVLFEAGLALGRFPTRTIIVEVGDLRPFSDIAGRHIIRLDNSIKLRQELAQRLATAGCKIDLSGTDWHQTGNFNVAESRSWEIVIDNSGKGYFNAKQVGGTTGSGIDISHKSDILNLVDCINRTLKQDERQFFSRYSDQIDIITMPSDKDKGFYYIERKGGNWVCLSKEDLESFRDKLRDILFSLI